ALEEKDSEEKARKLRHLRQLREKKQKKEGRRRMRPSHSESSACQSLGGGDVPNGSPPPLIRDLSQFRSLCQKKKRPEATSEQLNTSSSSSSDSSGKKTSRSLPTRSDLNQLETPQEVPDLNNSSSSNG
ncbi:unnamed protein product, partial [Cyprideis torosa]